MYISMTVIDFVFLSIILVFGILIAIKGFIEEFSGKAALILGIVCAVSFNGPATVFLQNKITYEWLAKILAFLGVFIITFLVISIIGKIISLLFQGKIMRGLDRTLGFFLGLLEGLLFVAFVYVVLTIQPFFDVQPLFQESFFAPLFEGLIPPAVSDSINSVTNTPPAMPL